MSHRLAVASIHSARSSFVHDATIAWGWFGVKVSGGTIHIVAARCGCRLGGDSHVAAWPSRNTR